MIRERLRQKTRRAIIENSRYRAICARVGAVLNRLAFRLAGLSRGCVRFMDHHVTHEESDWFVHGLPMLHGRIGQVLQKQRAEYGDLQPGGLLVFETHAADVGNTAFYEAIATFSDLFSVESKRDTDSGTRDLYLFRRISDGAVA